MATLCPTRTHTLNQMPKNLTSAVATPKRVGALPVLIMITNRLALTVDPFVSIGRTGMSKVKVMVICINISILT